MYETSTLSYSPKTDEARSDDACPWAKHSTRELEATQRLSSSSDEKNSSAPVVATAHLVPTALLSACASVSHPSTEPAQTTTVSGAQRRTQSCVSAKTRARSARACPEVTSSTRVPGALESAASPTQAMEDAGVESGSARSAPSATASRKNPSTNERHAAGTSRHALRSAASAASTAPESSSRAITSCMRL